MRDFIRYLKAPVENFKLPARKIWSVILLFFLLYILSIVVSILGYFLTGDDIPESKTRKMPAFLPLWFALIVPPLIEELSFRLWLKRNTVTIFISSVCFIWCIVSMLMVNVIYSTDRLVLRCLIALACGSVFTLLLKKQITSARFPVMFYLSAIVFGLIHLVNYQGAYSLTATIVLVVTLLINHSLSGLFYGYVRIGFGFFASVLFHIANNFLPVLYMYLKSS